MRFLLISFVIFSSLSFSLRGGYASPRAALLISPDVEVLLSTKSVKNLVQALNSISGNFAGGELRASLVRARNNFLKNTGVDLLNVYSLKKLGVDVSRPMMFAKLPTNLRGKRMLVIVPVFDGERFPLKFIRLVKKGSPKGADVFPVITPYRGHTLYQIGKDMFCCSVMGNFLIASSGTLIRRALDNVANPNASLLYQKYFIDAISKHLNSADLQIFMGKSAMQELWGGNSRRSKVSSRGRKGNFPGTSMPKLTSITTIPDYLYGGISLAPNELSFKTAVVWRRGNGTRAFPNFLGRIDRELSLKGEELSSIRFALDAKALKRKNGKGSAPLSKGEKIVLKKFKTILGLKLYSELLPRMKGSVEFLSGKISDSEKGYALRIPMKNRSAARQVYKKVERHFLRLSRGKGGSVKILRAGFPAFTVKRNGGVSVFALYKNNLVLASDTDFISRTGKLPRIKVNSLYNGLPVFAFRFSKQFLKNLSSSPMSTGVKKEEASLLNTLLDGMTLLQGRGERKGQSLYFYGKAIYKAP